MYDLDGLLQKTKIASVKLNDVKEEEINAVLIEISELLIENANSLKEANKIDLELARQKGQTAGYIDRLTLSDKVISSMAEGVKQVSELSSPVGKTVYSYKNEFQGILVEKKNVPFGVIGIIYESRPNVTVDTFALCFKTRNAVVLKGGSDSINSNKAIVKIIKQALINKNIDQDVVNLIEDTSRETATAFMKKDKFVDLLIPRGSASLIKATMENSTIPVIQTGSGNCHVYVDEFADIEKAVNIIFNAKTQRYSVCNACESLVIHSKILEKALPLIAKKLWEKDVEIRCDERAFKVIDGLGRVSKATDEDFYTEYGDAIISVKTVDRLSEAISHINEHSTTHSESIVTENQENAKEFMQKIDSSSVYHNASTRFSDGFVFGLGAEIGISTQKLHARGPMGLEGLVTTKYFVTGDGAIRK